MSSNLIQQPYPIILNPHGGGGSAKPAANAEYHVGEIDKDPVQYPRTDLAYKDESGTERLITSPIYTNNSGAFVASKNSSTIIQPYMKDGLGYSVLIKGRRGTIYESKSVGDPGNISKAEILADDTSTPRNLGERFADHYNVLDNGADKTGVASSVEAFIESVSKTKVLEVPPGSYLIDKDFTIPNTCTFDIKGKLVLADGVKVTFNGNIEAGHYQIFETGSGAEVLPTYWNNNTPQDEVPAIQSVKAAWFGVKNDAKHPATRDTPQDGTNVQGDQPIGTDSTEAMKAACKFAQYASFHAGWNDELHTLCPVELQPNGKIILKGDNPMGSQMWLEAISRMRLLPDYKTDPDHFNLTRSTIDFKIAGNGATILYVPLQASDGVFGETININQLYADNLTVLPMGYTGVGYGRLLKNNALVYEGSSGRDTFFNALTQQFFDRVKFTIPSGNVDSFGVDGETNPSGNIFTYEGYSLGDRLRINGGDFRNFKRFIYVLNPEAVEFKVENTSLASYCDGTRFYDYPAHYSQLHIENSLHLMKGDNQVLFNFIADYSAKFQQFGSAARVQMTNSRVEGSDGKDKTLLNANYGQFTLESFDSNTATNGESTGSRSAKLSRLATAEFKNANIANTFSVNLLDFDGSNPDVSKYAGSIRSPMLSFESCEFTGDGGRGAVMHNSTFNGVNYGQSLLNQSSNQNIRVPTVKFTGEPNTSRGGLYGYYVPFCTYYGNNNVPEGFDECLLFAPISPNGFSYPTKNTTGWQFPPWARISQVNLQIGVFLDTFTHVMIKIGQDSDPNQYVREFDIKKAANNADDWNSRGWNALNVLDDISAFSGSGRAIGTQTGDPEKLYTRIYFSDGSGNVITGDHPPCKISLKYRCLREAAEVVAINTPAADVR